MLTESEVHEREQACTDLLEAFANNHIGETQCDEVVYFRRLRARSDNPYEARRFSVHSSVSESIGNALASSIAQRTSDGDGGIKEICWYDAGTSSDKLFILPADELPDFEKMRNAALVGYSKAKLREVMAVANIQRCSLTCGEYDGIDVFARVQNQASLQRKHEILRIEDDRITAYVPNSLFLTYAVDAIVHDGMAIVYNRSAFEFIFSYKTALMDFIDKNSDVLVKSEVIEHGSEFVEACKGNAKRMQKLKLFLLEGRVDDLVAHRDNIGAVVEDFGLQVEVDGATIKYDPDGSPNQLDDILRLINRLCVTDALTNAKMFAAEIENPNVRIAAKGE